MPESGGIRCSFTTLVANISDTNLWMLLELGCRTIDLLPRRAT